MKLTDVSTIGTSKIVSGREDRLFFSDRVIQLEAS